MAVLILVKCWSILFFICNKCRQNTSAHTWHRYCSLLSCQRDTGNLLDTKEQRPINGACCLSCKFWFCLCCIKQGCQIQNSHCCCETQTTPILHKGMLMLRVLKSYKKLQRPINSACCLSCKFWFCLCRIKQGFQINNSHSSCEAHNTPILHKGKIILRVPKCKLKFQCKIGCVNKS